MDPLCPARRLLLEHSETRLDEHRQNGFTATVQFADIGKANIACSFPLPPAGVVGAHDAGGGEIDVGAFRQNRGVFLFHDLRLSPAPGEFVRAFDQEPLVLAVGGPAAHAHQMPAALEALAEEGKVELSLFQRLVRVAVRHPSASVPNDHRAAAVLTLGNDSFPLKILHRMIFGLHGETFLAGHEAWPAGYGPAFENAVELESQIEVQTPRVVFLNDKLIAARAAAFGRGFGGLAKIALLTIFLEAAHRPIAVYQASVDTGPVTTVRPAVVPPSITMRLPV